MTTKKPRLSLTVNKMPEDVYQILAEKGDSRRLTPYVVSLVEKEKQMDKIISSLSSKEKKVDQLIDSLALILDKVGGLENKVDGLAEAFQQQQFIRTDQEDFSQNEVPEVKEKALNEKELEIKSDNVISSMDETVASYGDF
ncbi:hypothetical protein ACQRXC_29175 (plasmid) [Niallia taxi]|uniref:hypothetical protein n=1 Tax=Niallia taxi TaxID=2499688 RepID=UPI003F61ABE8